MTVKNFHKGTEQRVRASICRTRIGDCIARTVEIGRRAASGFMRPHTVIAFSVPVKIAGASESGRRSDNEGDEMPGSGAFIIRTRRIDKPVANRC